MKVLPISPSRRSTRPTSEAIKPEARESGEFLAQHPTLCGWKTRDMFERYNIIDSADLSRAVAQRFSPNGKLTANKAVEVGQAN
jgi:hypothetical protein